MVRQISVCQRGETHTPQTAESGGFRVFRLCHLLEDTGLFLTRSISIIPLRNSWDFSTTTACSFPGAIPKTAWGSFVVRDSFMPSHVWTISPPFMSVIICVYVHAFSDLFFLFLQVYVPWRYAPGNSVYCALGFWALSVFVAEGGEVPCCVLLSRAVLCRAVCVWDAMSLADKHKVKRQRLDRICEGRVCHRTFVCHFFFFF